ncbi:MAG TPA: primosomal protein N' [Vicinamibacterales bacterium]|nr:primosomal protein N' [Vicinamibacterales bacterium]
MRLVAVAVPVPAVDALTYRVPDHLSDPVPGARVLVPVGTRVLTGVVIGVPDAADEFANPQTTAKDLIDILDQQAFLPADVLSLVRWVAEYYACGAGEALSSAMPPRAWIESERVAQITEAGRQRRPREKGLRAEVLANLSDDKPARVDTLATRSGLYGALAGLERDGLVEVTRPLRGSASAFRTVRVASLTAQGHEFIPAAGGAARPLGAKQLETIERLAGEPDGIDARTLASDGISAGTLKRLVELGLVAVHRRRIERDPFEQDAALPAVERRQVTLNAEQAGAFEQLRGWAESGTFQCALLHGVTGSGKTELYLRLADAVRRRGRGVLLLVPEIALTPAVAALFRGAFGERVAIQHSGLSDGERHDQWHRIRRGDVDVVVGTRSAVFAPVANVGLIIVDEEHDGSYKQEETPRYHGRDVAVVRAQQAGALAVLGSATPSMESYHNARNGRYRLVSLERRVLDRPMASVRIVDMREEFAAGGPGVILSAALSTALGDRISRQEQAIVLLNRRGFATVVFCRQCAHTLECPNCSVSLTVHKAIRRARCHYCNHATGIPTRCANCAGPYLEQLGFGTERVEAEIRALLPGARIARVDRDTIRRRGAITGLLSRFGAGELDILVGTQMIAKGHDFPRVTLVGVISADVGLGMADFRAGERTFQLLTQVAGRSGRGELAGEAIVQTLYPTHYSIRHACRQDYGAFFADEIEFRRRMHYPPVVAMINAVVRARTREGAMADAADIVRALRWGGEPYRVLGPAPAPLSRLKGEHRAQFFLKGSHRASMRKALVTALDARPEIRRRTSIDVDPMSVL